MNVYSNFSRKIDARCQDLPNLRRNQSNSTSYHIKKYGREGIEGLKYCFDRLKLQFFNPLFFFFL